MLVVDEVLVPDENKTYSKVPWSVHRPEHRVLMPFQRVTLQTVT